MTHSASTAPIIVYRTKADYTQYVPVRLSQDGSRIVAYPAPSDVRKSDDYRYPVKLKKGYYWDRQGVGATTAFLSITYAEYAALETAPDPETLLASILDSSPFLEMYHVGKTRDYQQVESELNEIIAQNRLNQFPSVLPEKKK
ncbi:MAG: hypothetical protein ACFB15_30010 [Cyclobacteriaceae bacterium]